MKQLLFKTWVVMLCLLVGVGSAWAENYATWTFESGTAGTNYPSNNTAFTATSGSCDESTFTMNGSGSQWNSTKGYAFTAITDMTVTLKLTGNLAAGSAVTFAADMFYNKASNAPMTGFNLTVSENSGSFVTTGLSATSISLSTSSANKSVTYTTQTALTSGQTIVLKYTQTGKAGAGQGYVGNITVDGPALTSGGSTDPVDASWSVDPTSVTVKASKTAIATITTNYNGTLSVSSANSGIATATINGKEITVSGVAEGSTTLTVTGAATSAYKAISKTIDVTVTANDRPENEIFYESFDTNEGTGGNDDQWSGTIASSDIDQDNDGWVYEKGSGASACAKFGTGSVLGSATTPALGQACNATLTFKAAAWNGRSENTTLKLSVIGGGTISPATVTLTKGEWNTFTATLTNLTVESKIKFEGYEASNSRFFLDEVSVVMTGYSRVVTNGSYGTICLPCAVTAPEGATFYSVSSIDNATGSLALTEQSSLVAGTPYIFKATANNVICTYSGEAVAEPVADTYLTGVFEATAAPVGSYVLQKHDGVVGFYQVGATVPTVGANRAYLNVASNARVLTFDEETAIKAIDALTSGKAEIFDLSGRRLNNLQKGINVVNGVKILVK